MKKLFIIGFALVALVAFAQSSDAYSVTLTEFTGDDAEVLLEITGDGTSSITFDVTVIDPIADLRAVFFDFVTLPSDLAGLTVAGADVTDYAFIEDGVQDLGGGTTIAPEGPFDAGIEIGLSGIGGEDDFQSTSFTVSYSENLVLGDFFGARLTSVGDDREGSSKLVGNYEPTDPPAPVPEPSTVLLLGAGLLGVLGLGRKFKK